MRISDLVDLGDAYETPDGRYRLIRPGAPVWLIVDQIADAGIPAMDDVASGPHESLDEAVAALADLTGETAGG